MNDFFEQLKIAFANQHTNNQKTLENINAIQKLLLQDLTHQELIHHLKSWKDDPSFSIQNYTFWIFILLAIICSILMIVLHPYFLILVILLIGFAFYKRISNALLKSFTQQIQRYILQKKYAIDFNQTHLDKSIQSPYDFPLFKLGNHENLIHDEIYGEWQINKHRYPYMLFNYHYVDKEETRDSEGKKKIEFRKYDLWGIVVENFPTHGISISTKQKRACRLGVKWSSGDIRFDQNYQLSGIHEILLAKFFTPNHILTLEKTLQNFKGDFYIHPKTSTLCWLFNVDILKLNSNTHSIKNIQDLAEYLEFLEMPHFVDLKNELHQLLNELQSN